MTASEKDIDARRELATIAREVLAGTCDVIDASRRIVASSRDLPEREDPVFLGFRGIHSESDTFPPEQARKLWEANYLSSLDQGRARYENRIRTHVLEDCQKLIDRYGAALEGAVLAGVTYELFESDQRALDAVRADRDHLIDRELRLELQDGSSVFLSWTSGFASNNDYSVSIRRDRHFLGTASLIRDVSDSAFWSPFLGVSIRLEYLDPDRMCMMLSSESERRFLSTWEEGHFGADVVFMSHDPPSERPYAPSSIQ